MAVLCRVVQAVSTAINLTDTLARQTLCATRLAPHVPKHPSPTYALHPFLEGFERFPIVRLIGS